jgi:hypothetical protein
MRRGLSPLFGSAPIDVATVSPSPIELHLDDFEVETHSITIQIATKRVVAQCPTCGEFSDRIHSRYTRRVFGPALVGVHSRNGKNRA